MNENPFYFLNLLTELKVGRIDQTIYSQEKDQLLGTFNTGSNLSELGWREKLLFTFVSLLKGDVSKLPLISKDLFENPNGKQAKLYIYTIVKMDENAKSILLKYLDSDELYEVQKKWCYAGLCLLGFNSPLDVTKQLHAYQSLERLIGEKEL